MSMHWTTTPVLAGTLAFLIGSAALAQDTKVSLTDLKIRMAACKAATSKSEYCQGMIMGERLALSTSKNTVWGPGVGALLSARTDCPNGTCQYLLRKGSRFDGQTIADLNTIGTMSIQELMEQGGELHRVAPTEPVDWMQGGIDMPILGTHMAPQIAN